MSEPMKTATFYITGRYGANSWAVASVNADLVWIRLSMDSPDIEKNHLVYQISEFTIHLPNGSSGRTNIRYNIISECIEEITKSGKLTAKGAIHILEHLRDGR